jgi:hypothetical protein
MRFPALCMVVAGLALTPGCGGGSNPPSAPVAAPATTVTVVAMVPQATQPTATVTVPAPAQPAADAAPAPAETAAQDQLWKLMTETRGATGNDTGRQSDLIKDRLTQLPAQQIVAFERTREALDRALYTYDIWAAAYVIEDGCQEDCFRDFRSYLISLGPSVYEAALKDPDSIASVVKNAEQGDWENADDVAPDAYSSKVGNDLPFDTSDLSGTPRGTPFNENDIASLEHRFPRLAAKFR